MSFGDELFAMFFNYPEDSVTGSCLRQRVCSAGGAAHGPAKTQAGQWLWGLVPNLVHNKMKQIP